MWERIPIRDGVACDFLARLSLVALEIARFVSADPVLQDPTHLQSTTDTLILGTTTDPSGFFQEEGGDHAGEAEARGQITSGRYNPSKGEYHSSGNSESEEKAQKKYEEHLKVELEKNKQQEAKDKAARIEHLRQQRISEAQQAAPAQKARSLFDTAYDKTMKGLQFLGGSAQVIGGVTLCVGSGGLGCAAGGVLIFHGGGNLAQSTGLTDDNFAAFAYIGAAEALGVENPEKVGRWSHLGVDLTGTAASALTKIPKLGAWKLFRWEPSDLQYSIQTPAGALGTMRDGGLAIDSATNID